LHLHGHHALRTVQQKGTELEKKERYRTIDHSRTTAAASGAVRAKSI
jgi:hypothetical protein